MDLRIPIGDRYQVSFCPPRTLQGESGGHGLHVHDDRIAGRKRTHGLSEEEEGLLELRLHCRFGTTLVAAEDNDRDVRDEKGSSPMKRGGERLLPLQRWLVVKFLVGVKLYTLIIWYVFAFGELGQ